jgi:hypothetical protein
VLIAAASSCSSGGSTFADKGTQERSEALQGVQTAEGTSGSPPTSSPSGRHGVARETRRVNVNCALCAERPFSTDPGRPSTVAIAS